MRVQETTLRLLVCSAALVVVLSLVYLPIVLAWSSRSVEHYSDGTSSTMVEYNWVMRKMAFIYTPALNFHAWMFGWIPDEGFGDKVSFIRQNRSP